MRNHDEIMERIEQIRSNHVKGVRNKILQWQYNQFMEEIISELEEEFVFLRDRNLEKAFEQFRREDAIKITISPQLMDDLEVLFA